MADIEAELLRDNAPEPEEQKVLTYPIVKFDSLPDETKPEIMDTITGAIERYTTDLEMTCRTIKEEMDKTYGPMWHVIIGESFGYDVSYQTKHIIHMYFMGNLGILVWKCG